MPSNFIWITRCRTLACIKGRVACTKFCGCVNAWICGTSALMMQKNKMKMIINTRPKIIIKDVSIRLRKSFKDYPWLFLWEIKLAWTANLSDLFTSLLHWRYWIPRIYNNVKAQNVFLIFFQKFRLSFWFITYQRNILVIYQI